MPTDRPDPGDFLELAQRMLRELFDASRGDDDPRDDDPRNDDDPWAGATRGARESFARDRYARSERHREPSAQTQRENLTFALATRAVEALEDLALNVAAIRQRLERSRPPGQELPLGQDVRLEEDRRPDEDDTAGR